MSVQAVVSAKAKVAVNHLKISFRPGYVEVVGGARYGAPRDALGSFYVGVYKLEVFMRFAFGEIEAESATKTSLPKTNKSTTQIYAFKNSILLILLQSPFEYGL